MIHITNFLKYRTRENYYAWFYNLIFGPFYNPGYECCGLETSAGSFWTRTSVSKKILDLFFQSWLHVILWTGREKNENFRFFAVSGKVKTNIWINIDLRKQLDSWEIFDIFWFEKTNIQIYPIFQMIFNRQKLIVLCLCACPWSVFLC